MYLFGSSIGNFSLSQAISQFMSSFPLCLSLPSPRLLALRNSAFSPCDIVAQLLDLPFFQVSLTQLASLPFLSLAVSYLSCLFHQEVRWNVDTGLQGQNECLQHCKGYCDGYDSCSSSYTYYFRGAIAHRIWILQNSRTASRL